MKRYQATCMTPGCDFKDILRKEPSQADTAGKMHATNTGHTTWMRTIDPSQPSPEDRESAVNKMSEFANESSGSDLFHDRRS